MRHTVSFALILYAFSAIADAALSTTTLDPNRLYAFRMATITMVLSIYFNCVDKKQSIKTISFFLASIVLSVIAMALGNLDTTTIMNIGIKMAATVLTIKPDIIEVEIDTENEEKP